MPTIRGFVERLEVGRGGLAVAAVLHDDGSRADYQLPDLDADPERFNERLSKLGLLRDALSRAEPVEIEYDSSEKDQARTIARVGRITRDMLASNLETTRFTVFIVGISLLADNRSGPSAEAGDLASVVTMTSGGSVASYLLDMQLPERSVATGLFQMLRDAQASGQSATLIVNGKGQRIVGVELGGDDLSAVPTTDEYIDGFVESVLVAPSLAPMSNLATVAFTTAPPFSAAGNVVPLLPFTPTLVQLLVVQGSVEYQLFVDGLRDKLRMRVLLGAAVGGVRAGGIKGSVLASGAPASTATRTAASLASNPAINAGAAMVAAPPAAPAAATAAPVATAPTAAGTTGQATTGPATEQPTARLVRSTQLVAALASASRPVWIRISRQSLDVGPDGPGCTDGLPTSDLAPQGLRDLRLPYTAEWMGWGCFNHGVYRLQFALGVAFDVFIDGKALCLHASDDGKTRFAHACLHDEHEVKVVLQRWTCDQVFQMDIYRIR